MNIYIYNRGNGSVQSSYIKSFEVQWEKVREAQQKGKNVAVKGIKK